MRREVRTRMSSVQGFEGRLEVPTWSPPCGPTGDLFVTWTPSSFYVTILFVTSQGPGTNQNESKAPVKQIPPLQASAHPSPSTTPTATTSTLPPWPTPSLFPPCITTYQLIHLSPRRGLPYTPPASST
ncbi:hypothetical protein E2C01_067905 [Portunus trituberculatus]|uniref:Uncharacterized protein n=1 Tax=Portunus trituberculatus TaxID=210409 RepID=A0A5B7HL34_PORTR|nr:hypothetical protein [Portunus trituberculatus]